MEEGDNQEEQSAGACKRTCILKKGKLYRVKDITLKEMIEYVKRISIELKEDADALLSKNREDKSTNKGRMIEIKH